MSVYTQLDELTTSHDNIRGKLVEKGVSAAATHGFIQFAGDIETLADTYDDEIADITADYEAQILTLNTKLNNAIAAIDGTASGVYTNNDLTKVEQYVFYDRAALTGIVMNNVTDVGRYAFYNCVNITSISMPLADTLRGSCFRNCSGLLVADFPAATTVGASFMAGCSSMTIAKFPLVTNVGGSCFLDCSALEEVEIGSTTNIGAQAFSNCTSLISVDLSDPARTSIPTLANVNAFNNTAIASGTGYIWINDELVDTLKSAAYWSTYATQIKPASEKP